MKNNDSNVLHRCFEKTPLRSDDMHLPINREQAMYFAYLDNCHAKGIKPQLQKDWLMALKIDSASDKLGEFYRKKGEA